MDFTSMWKIHEIIPKAEVLEMFAQTTSERMKEIISDNASDTRVIDIWVDNKDGEKPITLQTHLGTEEAVEDFLASDLGWGQVPRFIENELAFIYSEPNIFGEPCFRKSGKPVEVYLRLTDSKGEMIEN